MVKSKNETTTTTLTVQLKYFKLNFKNYEETKTLLNFCLCELSVEIPNFL